jgi:hypothetical protein
MAIQGKQREEKERQLFTGFTVVRVAAINPTKEDLDKMLGRGADNEGKEPVYLSKDDDGNDKSRMAVWMYDEKNDKYFVYSFTLTNKERRNKDNTKVQLINSTCTTYWCPLKTDEQGQVTSEPDEALLPDWFTHFTDKDTKEPKGQKSWRKAVSGEEELGTLIRAWLGRLSFYDADTEILIDTKLLFKGNVKELTSQIDGEFDTPFCILLGVRTDEAEPSKKYQAVYGKSFLPQGFIKYINNGMTFPTDASKKMWDRFEKEVNGEYGFKAFKKLEAFGVYNAAEDIAGGDGTMVPEPTSSEY